MYIYIHIYQSVQLVDDLLRSTEVAYKVIRAYVTFLRSTIELSVHV